MSRDDDDESHGWRRPGLDIFVHGDDSPHFRKLLMKLEAILATQTELVSDLNAVRDQVSKIGTETSATLTKVTELEALLAAAGNTSPEVDAALAEVKSGLQAVDDLVADAPVPTP